MEKVLQRIPLDKGPYAAEYVRNAFKAAARECGWDIYVTNAEVCGTEPVIESYRFEKGCFHKKCSLRLKQRNVATFLILAGGGKMLRVEFYPILTEKDECSEALLSLSLMGERISPE
jgi:hypothetical protein